MGQGPSKSGVELIVALDRRAYTAGDAIRGAVGAKVNNKKIQCAGISAQLYCVLHSRVDAALNSHSSKSAAQEDMVLLPTSGTSGEIAIAKCNTKFVKPGKYSFPFALLLPDRAPPSVLLHNLRGCFAAITYVVRVRFRFKTTSSNTLNRSSQKGGKSKADIVLDYWFRVFSRQGISRPVKKTYYPRGWRRFTCLCGGGFISLRVSIERDWYESDQECRVFFEIYNRTGDAVKEVAIHVEEMVSVAAKDKRRDNRTKGTKYIGTLNVAAGASSQGDIAMPFQFGSPSVVFPTLVVQHAIVLKLCMQGPGKNPKVRLPVKAYGAPTVVRSSNDRANASSTNSTARGSLMWPLSISSLDSSRSSRGPRSPTERHIHATNSSSSLASTQRSVVPGNALIFSDQPEESREVSAVKAHESQPPFNDAMARVPLALELLAAEGIPVAQTVSFDEAESDSFSREYSLQ